MGDSGTTGCQQEQTAEANSPISTLRLTLRDYQARELEFLENRKRAGITWDPGLGKTCGASTFAARRKLQRWLIIAPDNAFTIWRDDAPKWIRSTWPEASVTVSFIQGTAPQRQLMWQHQYDPALTPNEVLIRICTPDVFIRDWGSTIKVTGTKKKLVRFEPKSSYLIPQIVIFDEAKRIRNPESISYRVLSRFLSYYDIQHFLPLTGTPGFEPRHFWTMLSLINPLQFQSYWKFVYAFHEVFDTPFGKEIGSPRNLSQWHKILKEHFSVVKETDEGISEQRPPLTRQILPIELDTDQRRIYKDLERDLLALVKDLPEDPATLAPGEVAQIQNSTAPPAPEHPSIIFAQNQLSLTTRLRQLLVCPKILSPMLGYGAAIKDFAETVEPNQYCVIFCPFTAAFPFFIDYLRTQNFRHVYTLQGGMGTEAREDAIVAYRRNRGVIICSTLYAQAFSLEPATKSYAIGYDWDPDNNRQAEKRLHRLTTVNPVISYYYTFRGTIDERICDIVNIKQHKLNLTIPSNLRQLLDSTKI